MRKKFRLNAKGYAWNMSPNLILEHGGYRHLKSFQLA